MCALLLGGYAVVRWEQFKRDQGIVAVAASGLRITTNGITLRQFALRQQQPDGEQLAIEANHIRLGLPRWTDPLPADSLEMERAAIQWQPSAQPVTAANEPSALPNLDQLRQWASWLPRNGHIGALTISLPCASGVCREVGQLDWQHAGQQVLPAQARLALEHDGHNLAVTLDARQQQNVLQLDIQALLDGAPRLAIQNQFMPDEENIRWLGSLSLSGLPEAPWLLDWFGTWLPSAAPSVPRLPEQMRVGAGWAVTFHTQTLMQRPALLGGELSLSANLPTPWPVVGVGQLQGQLDLGVTMNDGAWIADNLTADLALKPNDELVSVLPEPLRPAAVTVKIEPGQADGPTTDLPLHFRLETSGLAPISLHGEALFDAVAPFSLTLEQTQLKTHLPTYRLTDAALKGIAADLQLNGVLSTQAASITLNEGSTIKLQALSAPAGLAAQDLRVALAGTHMQARFSDLNSLTLTAKPGVVIGSLHHPALRPQGWRWNGTLALDPKAFSLDGPLTNDAGLTVPVRVLHEFAGALTRLDATLPELYLRAGNPLAATLAGWPQPLELNTGRLEAKAQLVVSPAEPLGATASLVAKGVGGIYDRTEFSGLDAVLSATVQRDQLRLDVAELSVREVNPGFIFGPLRYQGRYTAPLDAIGDGRLAWEAAEAQLLGGRFWLEPGAADLAADTQHIEARLRGLQLPKLFEAYPAEGLSGTGLIDGKLNIQRTPAGIRIEQGSVQAREPGGALQFRSPKIQALGQSNPAMRLVTEALDDFHYDRLASDVRYDTDGKLDLNLKLNGRNPALEGGRPINFSINLQEDIPALLTSLQLSDRVSETIQRRVQEQIRKNR